MRSITTRTQSGGINVQEGSSCTIKGGNITGNKAEDSDGGICAKGRLIMTGGSIQGNRAEIGGGLFCTEKATDVSLKNVTISGNKSDSNGPGININNEGLSHEAIRRAETVGESNTVEQRLCFRVSV